MKAQIRTSTHRLQPTQIRMICPGANTRNETAYIPGGCVARLVQELRDLCGFSAARLTADYDNIMLLDYLEDLWQ